MRSRSLRLDACLRSTRSGVADLGKDMWGFTNVPVRTVHAFWRRISRLQTGGLRTRLGSAAGCTIERVDLN